MLKPMQLALLSLFVAILAGCSVQKRTLMPGYHVEWGGGQNSIETSESSSSNLAFLTGRQVKQISMPTPAVERVPSPIGLLTSKQIARIPRIPPKEVAVNSAPAEPQDPAPWEEAYNEQKMFGKLAFLAFALGMFSPLLLAQYLSLSSATLLITLFGSLTLILFIANRRKRKQVLEIKEANGVDTSGERWRPSRKAAVGTGLVVASGWFWVAIMTAFFAALFSVIESILTFGWI